MEFNVKIWKKFQWKKRVLIIRENDFQLKKVFKPQKKKKQKETKRRCYLYIFFNRCFDIRSH